VFWGVEQATDLGSNRAMATVHIFPPDADAETLFRGSEPPVAKRAVALLHVLVGVWSR
jgi:hypothetical protein